MVRGNPPPAWIKSSSASGWKGLAWMFALRRACSNGLATLLSIERSQLQAVSQPAAQRRMNSELEAGQKPVVADQYKTEGHLIKLGAQQKRKGHSTCCFSTKG
jgi:hypothetical protein